MACSKPRRSALADGCGRPLREDEDRYELEAEATESTFRQLFENVPGLYLIIEPDDYEIVAVSDAYLEATMTERTAILGKTLFEVFPADPADPDPEGVPRLRASLGRVKEQGDADVMPVTYYPIPIPESEDGGFEDRWWSPTNSPVFNASGEIDYIVHRVEDVTPVVRQFQADGEEDLLDDLDPGDSHLAADVILRGDELQQAKERAYDRLRESEAELAAELEATRELQEISTELIQEDDVESLSDRVLDAAVGIMDADFASVQLYDPDRNDLELITHRGFNEEAESAWTRVSTEDASACSMALRTGERVIVPDVETCEFMAGTADREIYLQTGIRAVQTTPLVSRRGDVLGMFSTHWETPHDLSERDLGRLDVLARQAADLIQHQLDVETLTRMNHSLERLNASSTELIDAGAEEIADRAASLARDLLDVEYAALWQYDEVAGELRERASHTDPSVDLDEIRFPDAFPDTVWQTFIGDDIAVRNDREGHDGATEASTLRSRVLVPLGRHGVLCAGSLRSGTFDEQLIDLAETVAATIETAWDRAEGQQQLATRNAELERLDQLNALIRGIDKAIVDADSPDAIEQSVCDRLAGSGLYEFAWIGERDPASETVVPRAWAGVDDGYLENLAIPTVDEPTNLDPVAGAIRTRELQVVEDVATDSRVASRREAILERGARSCVSIPLVYEESPYGVLTVYTGRPKPDDRDNDVLAELGEIIAHAMAAAETRQALQSDSVTELALEIEGSEDVLQALAREASCEIEFDGFVPGNGSAPRVFFTSPGEASEAVLAAASKHPGIGTIQSIREKQGVVTFEATVTGSTVAAYLVSNQGVIRSLTATSAGTTVVVDLPATLPVREFLDAVRTAYPRTELVGRNARERRITTRQHLQDAMADEFTARQREVLETAYRSGFFESPRTQTGQELADGLDISQSTFTHHLREGERKVFEMVFENAKPPR